MKIAKSINTLPTANGFRIITVGSGSPPIDIDRVSPCTLVQYNDIFFAVDLGYGASRRMFEGGINYADISNVLFTHLHADHALDYGYFLIMGWHDGRKKLNIIGPDGTKAMHESYCKMFEKDISYRAKLGISLKGILDDVAMNEIKGSEIFELDGVKISTINVPHTAYTVAYKFEAGSKRVVVTGDMLYNEPVIDFMRDADMVVFDANQANSTFLQERGPNFVANLNKSHAKISEVATMARNANVKSMVLTHLTPGTFIGELVQQISKVYDGEIIVAHDMLSVDV